MRMRVNRRLVVIETQRSQQRRRPCVDLSRLRDEDLDVLERLALNRQAWQG